MPVAKIRRENVKGTIGISKTPTRNNSYIRTKEWRTSNSPARIPRPPKMMLRTAIAVIPPVRSFSTLASCYGIFDGNVGRLK
jgi:hypothetical protein